MNSIAKVQTESRDVNQLQQNICQAVDPVLQNPLVDGNLLSSVSLNAGSNVINHGLGRKLQGWFLTRKRADSSIYDTQDANRSPAVTLQLVSSAAVSVDIYVF